MNEFEIDYRTTPPPLPKPESNFQPSRKHTAVSLNSLKYPISVKIPEMFIFLPQPTNIKSFQVNNFLCAFSLLIRIITAYSISLHSFPIQ